MLGSGFAVHIQIVTREWHYSHAYSGKGINYWYQNQIINVNF